MADLDAIYRVIHQPSGHVVDDYTNEASALACVERENEEYPESHVVVKYVRADQAPPAAANLPEIPDSSFSQAPPAARSGSVPQASVCDYCRMRLLRR